MAGNHLPRITGTDYGIWRRIALVPFNQEFKDQRKDCELPDKLGREFDGILAWLVRGCLEWQREGLKVPERVKAATNDYRTSQDHLGMFLAESCVVADTAHVSAGDLRGAYMAWCEEQGETPWSPACRARRTTRGYDSGTTGRGNDKVRTWFGVGLKA